MSNKNSDTFTGNFDKDMDILDTVWVKRNILLPKGQGQVRGAAC